MQLVLPLVYRPDGVIRGVLNENSLSRTGQFGKLPFVTRFRVKLKRAAFHDSTGVKPCCINPSETQVTSPTSFPDTVSSGPEPMWKIVSRS